MVEANESLDALTAADVTAAYPFLGAAIDTIYRSRKSRELF
jgi:hypothetical protein